MASAATALGLADMPSAWLAILPDAISPPRHELQQGGASHKPALDKELLALFRTCRLLRDIILSERCVHLHFDLPIPLDATAAAQAKLLQLPHIILSLGGVDALPPELYKDASASACSLLVGTVEAAGKPLTSIKRVELKKLNLAGLVPPWLTSTCPNLQQLHLHDCQFSQLPDPATTIPSCSQLKQLHLTGLPYSKHATASQWQHQLRALPSLESVVLVTSYATAAGAWLEGSLAPVCPQITQLQFPSPDRMQLPLQLPAWFPHIRDLTLTSRTVTDADMDVLLRMHSCQRLSCQGFQLQQDHSHSSPCPWTQLGVTDLDVASFARLPLGGVKQLQHVSCHNPGRAAGTIVTVIPDEALTTAAFAAISACGGLGWKGLGTIQVNCNGCDGVESCLTATLRLLSTCTADKLQLSGARLVTIEPLAALPAVPTIVFQSCMLYPSTLKRLLHSLPARVRLIRFTSVGDQQRWNLPVTENQLTEVCVAAKWPISVEVECHANSLQDGWRSRVEAAMAKAGHHHVTLK